jgi:hypothetical protein
VIKDHTKGLTFGVVFTLCLRLKIVGQKIYFFSKIPLMNHFYQIHHPKPQVYYGGGTITA